MTDSKGNELKIGDKVIVLLEYLQLEKDNKCAVIISFRGEEEALVKFKKYQYNLHDGNCTGEEGYYWYCVSEELQKIDDCLKIKIRKLKRLIKK